MESLLKAWSTVSTSTASFVLSFSTSSSASSFCFSVEGCDTEEATTVCEVCTCFHFEDLSLSSSPSLRSNWVSPKYWQRGLQMCDEKKRAMPLAPRLASPYSFAEAVWIWGSV